MQYFMNAAAKPHNGSKRALLNLMLRVYREKFNEDAPLMVTREWFKQYIEYNRHYTADSTQYQSSRTAELYLEFLESRGQADLLLDDNTPPLIKQFGAYLVTTAKLRHVVAGANARLEKLETLFAEAMKGGHMTQNPAKGVRLKDRAAESEEELAFHQPYSKSQIYTAIDRGIAPGCNPEMAVAHLLSVDSGARPGDVFSWCRRMFHRDPELKKNFMKYYARKPKKWHKLYPFDPTVPLIIEYLDYHLMDHADEALFFPSFGYPTGPEIPDKTFNRGSSQALTYYGMYLDALDARKLLSAELEGRKVYSHSGHSGRVTCITMLAQANFNESVARKRVLHEGSEVHRIYQKHSPESIQRLTNQEFNDEGVVNITLEEFKAAVTLATEKLRSLRGKLDLKNGVLLQGDRIRRARLIAV